MKMAKVKSRGIKITAVLALSNEDESARLRAALHAAKKARLELRWIFLAPSQAVIQALKSTPGLRGVDQQWLERGPGGDWAAFVSAAVARGQSRLLLLPSTWDPSPQPLQELAKRPEKDWLQARRGSPNTWGKLVFWALGTAPMDLGAPSLLKSALLKELGPHWPSRQELLGPRLLRLARLRGFSVEEVGHGQASLDTFSALGFDKNQFRSRALRLLRQTLMALATAGVGALIYRAHATLGLLLIIGGLMAATYLFGKSE
jgi:hypothetical protein